MSAQTIEGRAVASGSARMRLVFARSCHSKCSVDPVEFSISSCQICNTVFIKNYELYVAEWKAVKQGIILISSGLGSRNFVFTKSYAVVFLL